MRCCSGWRPCASWSPRSSTTRCRTFGWLWLAVPAALLLAVFVRRELRLTRARQDPLVDLRLFTRPSYSVGVGLALLYFAGATGLPLVLALYYQRGLGYTALESGLGITAYALGSVIAAPLAGRAVTRIGRPLVVGGLVTFGLGALAIDLTVRLAPEGHTALWLAPPLLVLGLGAGAVITPNQTLSLMDVDARMGSTAGGVLQTSQRIGSAVGQAVIGASFFAALTGSWPATASRPGRRERRAPRGVRPGALARHLRHLALRRRGARSSAWSTW